MAVELIGSNKLHKAVICLDCLAITYVELPTGLVMTEWGHHPLPPDWEWVISKFAPPMGDCVRAQCDTCIMLIKTDMEGFHNRYANARNVTFSDPGPGGQIGG